MLHQENSTFYESHAFEMKTEFNGSMADKFDHLSCDSCVHPYKQNMDMIRLERGIYVKDPTCCLLDMSYPISCSQDPLVFYLLFVVSWIQLSALFFSWLYVFFKQVQHFFFFFSFF